MSVLEYSNAVANRNPTEWTIHPCRLCKFKTTSMFFLANHTKHHDLNLRHFNCETSSVEMYFCKDCNYTTDMLAVLNMHIKTCHLGITISEIDIAIATRKYFCNCGFTTHSYFNWYKHDLSELCKIKSCSKQLYKKRMDCFACENCEFKTKHKVSMKRHKCDKWGYKVKLNSYMKEHIIQLDDDTQGFACDKCGYKSKQKTTMRRHVAFNHLGKDEIWWFKCDKCDYRAKVRSNLKRHILNNHEIRRFECHKCDYKVKMKSSLERHIRVKHLGLDEIRKFECGQCCYKSRTKSDLKRHITSNHLQNHEIPWFQCEQCGFKTKRKDYLKKHGHRVHLGG